ncbi:MAG: trypsin-like peptidase domain-containing protein [Anaerolineales bacterium]|nr:trypsin-like peptidase domain-containing protein [Anaerolineales bacterium]
MPFVWGMFAALLAVLLYNLIFPNDTLSRSEVDEAIASAMASATPRPAFSAQVYPVIAPSLVAIETNGTNAAGEAGHSFGSGVIVNEAGEILTSLHVVADASEITVFFADGTQAPAVLALAQPEIDIAVLQPARLPREWFPATLGNPGAMRVGDEAFVLGNPFGLPWSFSAGVISGFDRTFNVPNSDKAIAGMIQFDAAANPGNSGGPLLNRSGHVIGIVTGILNPTDDSFFVGVGFAVPIGTATGGMGSPPY